LSFASKIRDGERTIDIYLPAGYDSGDRRYPLLLVNEGDEALKIAKMDVSLDNLIGVSAAPVIVAFVPAHWTETMGDNRDSYVRMLTEELVPHLDKTYRTQADPASRGIMGTMGGAAIASYAALKQPGCFGKLATQSFIFLRFEEELSKLIAEADPSQLDAYIEISSNDFKRSDIDAAADSRKLAELLRKRGIPVHEQAVTGAPSWSSWRAQTGIILEWFAPLAR
jgi:enterochelin esterase-like enzyme